MEANLLYGVQVIVQKARLQNRSDKMQILELQCSNEFKEPTKKKKKQPVTQE